MKRALDALTPILVVLTLVGLAVWAVSDWYQKRDFAERQVQTTLRTAAGALTDQTLHPGSDNLPVDRSALERLTQLPGWKVVLLSSPEHGTEYYWGPRPEVAAQDQVPHWAPRNVTEVLVEVPVFVASGAPQSLEALVEFYGRREIFDFLKACGWALAGLLVLTTMTLLWSWRREKDDPAESEPPESREVPVEPSATTTNSTDVTNDDESPWHLPDLGDELPQEDDYWFDEGLSLEELPELEPPLATEPEPKQEPEPQEILQAALTRASGLDSDIALVLFGFPENASPWVSELRSHWGQEPLERDGCWAMILEDSTLEQALTQTREFLEKTAAAGLMDTVNAGVAARSGRQVSAEVLWNEAASAWRRTQRGSARVLGLKIDAEKWRAHQRTGLAS